MDMQAFRLVISLQWRPLFRRQDKRRGRQVDFVDEIFRSPQGSQTRGHFSTWSRSCDLVHFVPAIELQVPGPTGDPSVDPTNVVDGRFMFVQHLASVQALDGEPADIIWGEVVRD
jgi:hypothetical protein